MMLDTVQLKLTEVKKRLEKIERKVEQQEAVQRVSQHLQRTNVTSAALKVAPADYYSWSLEKRGYTSYMFTDYSLYSLNLVIL
jgi:hypothetical protein